MRTLAKCGILLCAGTYAFAQTFTTIANFNGANGSQPYYETLIQGTDGELYGTTENGGASNSCASGCGTIFRVTRDGVLTTLVSFDQTNGAQPYAGLTLGIGGEYYGMTYAGGDSGQGTVFRMSPAGQLTPLHSFSYLVDGANPMAALIQAADGNFYGTTFQGGTLGFLSYGTVFKITASGALTTFLTFNIDDGAYPEGALIQAADGDLYGTANSGGTYFYGSVFQITPARKFTTYYSFSSPNLYPQAGLLQGSDGSLYGTAYGVGNNPGTIFAINTNVQLTTLHTFCSEADCADGEHPTGPLIQATDGNYYGMTPEGGANGLGTIFQVTSTGTYTVLYTFAGSDGSTPYGGLLQATDGNFYGTTYAGGASSGGTVFRFSTGLGPFIKTLPTIAAEGARVMILGYGLTGATSVTFNGTPASFTVNSSGTAITTSVPEGASSGPVEVVAPGGALLSNTPFVVR